MCDEVEKCFVCINVVKNAWCLDISKFSDISCQNCINWTKTPKELNTLNNSETLSFRQVWVIEFHDSFGINLLKYFGFLHPCFVTVLFKINSALSNTQVFECLSFVYGEGFLQNIKRSILFCSFKII